MFEKVLSFPLPYCCIFLQISITVSLSFFAYFVYQRLFVKYSFCTVAGKNKTEQQNLQHKHKLKTESQNPQH